MGEQIITDVLPNLILFVEDPNANLNVVRILSYDDINRWIVIDIIEKSGVVIEILNF